ncbi:hypothetical protein MtrunA17_Chr6g0472411 [Medicago truncatula]|uniref:Uncharacterized protein n=1 Tax=Medicago truncatula TaxID=3880 RepID=A0A396HEJ2_MEDTR|nr:hypothetical protein MtrunA17_Chr6g0472411 [Medicago truncatula]
MDIFSKTVANDPYGGVTKRVGQMGDEIHGELLPDLRWCSVQTRPVEGGSKAGYCWLDA